jgi:hypothetical protein
MSIRYIYTTIDLDNLLINIFKNLFKYYLLSFDFKKK